MFFPKHDSFINVESLSTSNKITLISLFLTMIGIGRQNSTFLILLAFLVLIYLFLTLESNSSQDSYGGKVIELENILSDEEKMLKSNGNQIFFIESHLEELRELKNARQACAVESAGS